MDRPRLEPQEPSADAAPEEPVEPSDDWVRELVAMTRPGVEIEFPARQIDERQVPLVYDDFD